MESLSVAGSLLKVVAIFVLLMFTLKLIGRFGGGKVRTARGQASVPVEVMTRSSVGRHASVVAVRMGSKCYALGVTEQSVSLISEIDCLPEPMEEAPISNAPAARTPTGAPVPSWRDFVENLRERTTRR